MKKKYFDELKNYFGFSLNEIIFHQRDSQEHKNNLSKITMNTNTDSCIYYSIFSTLMIELALSGEEVYCVFGNFSHLFSEEYQKYVFELCRNLRIDVYGKSPIKINPSDITNLCNSL